MRPGMQARGYGWKREGGIGACALCPVEGAWLPRHTSHAVLLWLAIALAHTSRGAHGGGGDRGADIWRGAIETVPSDLQIVDEDLRYLLACKFSIDPPPGGSFAMHVNKVPAYQGTSPETQLQAHLATGMWHTVSCSVLDDGLTLLAARDSTFLVRKGSSSGAHLRDEEAGEGGHLWVQRHDACGEEWEDGHENGAVPGQVPALDALHACRADDDVEYEIEGLVDHETWYPPHAELLLEERFYEFYISNWKRFPKDMVYVPIMWISHDHNRQLFSQTYRPTVFDLAEHVRRKYSDPKKRYFTVMQADTIHPELQEAMPSNCLIFSSSSYGHFALPLTTQFHNSRPVGIREFFAKPFLASFLGRNTNHIRGKLIRLYGEDPDFIIFSPGFASSMMNINQENQGLFRFVTTKSVFTLCPRGNGPSSFRIFESLEHGSIPVYIYDEDACFPFSDVINWSSFAVLVHHDELVDLKDLLLSFSQDDITSMRQRGAEVLDQYFSLNGTHTYILETLNQVDRVWATPSEPPVMRPISMTSSADLLLQRLSRLVENHREENQHYSENARGEGSEAHVLANGWERLSELQAVSGGMILLRQCIADGFNGRACDDSFILANKWESHHSALYLRGLLHLYVNGDKDSAQRFFLASLSLSPAQSMGMLGLEMIYGRGNENHDEVQMALASANILESSAAFRRYSVHQSKRREDMYCLPALDRLQDGLAGEKYLAVAHAALACRSVAGQRIMVVPEEIFGEFDEEKLSKLVQLIGYESLQQIAQQTYILQPQAPLTARLLYSSPCFAKSHGCSGLFEALEVRWEVSAPLVPAYKLRSTMSGLEYVRGKDLQTMTAGFSEDNIIALDAVPLMHDLEAVQRCAERARPHTTEALPTLISADECELDLSRGSEFGIQEVADHLQLALSEDQETFRSEMPCDDAASVLIYIERATGSDFSYTLAETIVETLIRLTRLSQTEQPCGIHVMSDSPGGTFATALNEMSKTLGLDVVSWEDVDVSAYEDLARLHARAVRSRLFMGTKGSAATASALLVRSGREKCTANNFATF